jgi:hypothetical protein
MSPMSLVGAPDRGLVLGYSRLPAERIDGAVAALADVMGSVGALPAGRVRRQASSA